MGFLVSPGVEVKEIDLTNVIPAISTSIGGYVGKFNWGPVGELITVSSENDLTEVFGKPNAGMQSSVLQAGSFLKYGNTLKISRAVQPLDDGATTIQNAETITATAGASTSVPLTNEQGKILIENKEDFDSQVTGSSFDNIVVAARCPGLYGNSIRVLITRGSNSHTYSGSVTGAGSAAAAGRWSCAL